MSCCDIYFGLTSQNIVLAYRFIFVKEQALVPPSNDKVQPERDVQKELIVLADNTCTIKRNRLGVQLGTHSQSSLLAAWLRSIVMPVGGNKSAKPS